MNAAFQCGFIEALESRIAPATFLVTSSADDGGPDTLRGAVRQANESPGIDRIEYVAPDAIQLEHGEIKITDPVVIVGFDKTRLLPGATIDAQGKSRIFAIDYAPGTVPMPTVISHFKLLNGRVERAVGDAGSEIGFGAGIAPGNESSDTPDGGALLSYESVRLDHVTVSGSYAAGSGGGVAIMTDGLASVTACSFVGNVAKNDGGGLFLEAGESARVSKSAFALNVAKHSGGGLALHVAADAMASAVVDGSSFKKNVALLEGGGLDLVDKSATKVIALRQCVVSANHATALTSHGGGIHIASGGAVLTGCTIAGNSAVQDGGGLSGQAAGVSIAGGRFVNNVTTSKTGAGGGGLSLSGVAHLTVTGSLFSGNRTAAYGGGLLLGKGVIASLKSSTVAGNSAGIDGPQIFAKGASLKLSSVKLR